MIVPRAAFVSHKIKKLAAVFRFVYDPLLVTPTLGNKFYIIIIHTKLGPNPQPTTTLRLPSVTGVTLCRINEGNITISPLPILT